MTKRVDFIDVTVINLKGGGEYLAENRPSFKESTIWKNLTYTLLVSRVELSLNL